MKLVHLLYALDNFAQRLMGSPIATRTVVGVGSDLRPFILEVRLQIGERCGECALVLDVLLATVDGSGTQFDGFLQLLLQMLKYRFFVLEEVSDASKQRKRAVLSLACTISMKRVFFSSFQKATLGTHHYHLGRELHVNRNYACNR